MALYNHTLSSDSTWTTNTGECMHVWTCVLTDIRFIAESVRMYVIVCVQVRLKMSIIRFYKYVQKIASWLQNFI